VYHRSAQRFEVQPITPSVIDPEILCAPCGCQDVCVRRCMIRLRYDPELVLAMRLVARGEPWSGSVDEWGFPLGLRRTHEFRELHTSLYRRRRIISVVFVLIELIAFMAPLWGLAFFWLWIALR
jgi:hypothetical protein